MTNPPRPRPGGILDFNHQFRPHPLDGTVDWVAGDQQLIRRRSLQVGQAISQRCQFSLGKAGADTAGIVQPSLRIEITDMKCTYALPAAARRRPAEHNELIPAQAFHLQPTVAATSPIGCISLFADNAFKVHVACVAAHLMGVAGDMSAETEQAPPISQFLQDSLAVQQLAGA